MRKLKFAPAALAAALSLAAPVPASASGIPVIDAASITQAVLQITELQKQYEMLTSQYEQLQKQYSQLQTITNKIEGLSGANDLLRFDWSKLSMFPEFYDDLTDYSVDVMETGAKAIYELRGYDAKCEGLDTTLQDICKQEYAYSASREYQFIESMKKIEDRMDSIDSLIDQIGQCETAKEIADLQARIEAETAYLQLANMQAEISKATFEASIDGAKRAREAKITKYFTVDSSSLTKAFD